MLENTTSPALDQKSAPNEGQQKAADAFLQFLFSKDKEFNLSGPGGVGKTYWMGLAIDQIIPIYRQMCKMTGIDPIYNEVHMTATTNKAAAVLSVATGRPCSTIHSFLGLKVQDDYSTGRSKIVRSRQWQVRENMILFIDECSMIDTALYNEIQAGTFNCKIVYIGDHCQLAPVMESISPVYRNQMPFYELTEQMRTKNPILQSVNKQLRETVETKEFQPIPVIPGVIDYLTSDHVIEELENYFSQQTHTARVLAYTNNRVMEFNGSIRDIRSLPDNFGVGELLVNNSAVQIQGSMLSVEQDIEILKTYQIDPMDRDEIVSGTFLQLARVDIETSLGVRFENVAIPADYGHFHELVRYFGKHKNWNRYYHLKNLYPDLRPRDAATTHKAQGSTYDVVFIDLGNISTCRQADQVARMLYVAFSRARHRVFLYGDLAEKYGGLTY